MLGRTRIFMSAPNVPPIAILGIQKYIPQLLYDCAVCLVRPALLRTVVQVAVFITLHLQNFATPTGVMTEMALGRRLRTARAVCNLP